MNLFDGLAFTIIYKTVGENRPPEVLWHYTGSDGLLGILGSNSLRFGDATFMNDGSELHHGFGVFADQLHIFMQDKTEEEREVADRLQREVDESLRRFSSVIFCLCADGNLLNQWRDYGKDVVPFAIGFDTESLNGGMRDFCFSFYLAQVIYDLDLQKEIMARLVLDIYEAAQHIPDRDQLSEEDAKPYYEQAAIQVMLAILRFKNPAFGAELEWRLITHRLAVQMSVVPEFRSSPLGIVPFYTCVRTGVEKKLPVKTVIVGPSSQDPQTAMAGLNTFLIAKGYVDVLIQSSTIPIRRA